MTNRCRIPGQIYNWNEFRELFLQNFFVAKIFETNESRDSSGQVGKSDFDKV